MYIAISDISNTIYPLDYIDNRSGELKIGLRRITFCLDWWNTSGGHISIDTILDAHYENMKIDFNKINGIIKITPTRDSKSITFEDPELLKMLKIKFDSGTFEECTIRSPCESYTAVDLMPIKLLNIHCNQVNSKDNFFDGTPSTLLTSVPVGNHIFGDIITYNFPSPEYKTLKLGTISELKIVILDQDNKEIVHHSEVPVSCTLEIIP